MPGLAGDEERRRPVWEALSDLFLDTELQDSQFRYIARILAESGYSEDELHSILFREVYPVCIGNLHHPAGVWSGFQLDWLEEQIRGNRSRPGTKAPVPPPDYWMIEREWRRVLELLPQAMLSFLHDCGMLSDRKARLFSCAAVRQVWHLLNDERSRRAVEVAECFADGRATEKDLRFAFSCAADAYAHAAAPSTAEGRASAGAANAARPEAGYYARYVTPREEHTALIRDLFGPLPFRPISLPRSVRIWNGGLVRRLAEQAYNHRIMPAGTLDPARLAVLADALLEAGCDDADILGHLREPGPHHWRGCHVLDAILGRA